VPVQSKFKPTSGRSQGRTIQRAAKDTKDTKESKDKKEEVIEKPKVEPAAPAKKVEAASAAVVLSYIDGRSTQQKKGEMYSDLVYDNWIRSIRNPKWGYQTITLSRGYHEGAYPDPWHFGVRFDDSTKEYHAYLLRDGVWIMDPFGYPVQHYL